MQIHFRNAFLAFLGLSIAAGLAHHLPVHGFLGHHELLTRDDWIDIHGAEHDAGDGQAGSDSKSQKRQERIAEMNLHDLLLLATSHPNGVRIFETPREARDGESRRHE